MTAEPLQVTDSVVLDSAGLQALLDALARQGYRVLGPRIGNGAVVHGRSPRWPTCPREDERPGAGPGTVCRTKGTKRCSDTASPPTRGRSFCCRPSCACARSSGRTAHCGRSPTRLRLPASRSSVCARARCTPLPSRTRFSLPARTLDPSYKAQRDNLFIVAANCGQAGRTCFCVSMKTGPRATGGFDLALTEVVDAARHFFLVEIGSARGADLVGGLPHRTASAEDKQAADAVVAHAAAHMGRTLDTDGLKELLYRNHEHPRWDEVAERCLTCANCTMVCPTCFCTTVEDMTDLTGTHAERRRKWDSCFTLDFSLHPRRQHPAVGQGALPPVADAQAGVLDRPVRHVGLRRLRPVHHLVPGGDRPHRGSKAIREIDRS